MFDVSVIIPCYGKSSLINRGLSALSTQWKKEYLHVILVNDCSPNTDCDYQDLVDRYKDEIDIKVIKTKKNAGQGLARQVGIDACETKWFLFQDEDDQYTPLAISQIVGCVETYGLITNEDGMIKVDENGKWQYEEGLKEIAVVSAPLFEWDDNHTHVIPSDNRVWLNAKLYNKEFLDKHNIRFNKAQSRHAEDYYFTSCFFHALDNDLDYVGLLLDDNGLYYLWFPNEQSQSRVDPNYGFMLSGYTMDGSVNILKFMRENNTIGWNEDIEEQYIRRVLDMTVYSYYTFLSFIRQVASTDYVPKLKKDWLILRDACAELRRLTKENWGKYSYVQKLENLFNVKNNSDVLYSEPWVTFDSYIEKGMKEFSWDFTQLLKCKKTYKFNENGVRAK